MYFKIIISHGMLSLSFDLFNKKLMLNSQTNIFILFANFQRYLNVYKLFARVQKKIVFLYLI